jgi:hypothetical protein
MRKVHYLVHFLHAFIQMLAAVYALLLLIGVLNFQPVAAEAAGGIHPTKVMKTAHALVKIYNTHQVLALPGIRVRTVEGSLALQPMSPTPRPNADTLTGLNTLRSSTITISLFAFMGPLIPKRALPLLP